MDLRNRVHWRHLVNVAERFVHSGSVALCHIDPWFCLQHYKQDADGLVTNLRKPVVAKNEFIKHGWQIKQSDIKLGEQIGKGQFGGA